MATNEDTVIELDDNGVVDRSEKTKKNAIVVDDESPNLAIEWYRTDEGKAELKAVADQVIQDFDDAWDSSESYRDRVARDWKLFTGDLPKKDFPFENCANAHIPMALENVSRLAFRAYGELFGRDEWLRVLPMGDDDREIARIMTKHDNWQFQYQISDFRRQMHRGILAFYHIGDVACDSYRDPMKGRNQHEIMTPDDFVVPYVATSTEPDYSDVPFKIKICNRYRHEMERMRDEWADVDKVLERGAPGEDDDPETKLRDAVAETNGIHKPDSSRNAPYRLLQYDGWFKFSSEENQRYIRAIVDYQTHCVLSVRIFEEDDWEDRLRYEAEMAELESFTDASQRYPMEMEQAKAMEEELRMRISDPMVHPQERAMVEQALTQMPLPQPPKPPSWMGTLEDGTPDVTQMPEPVRKVPINMYSHGVCIEPLVGLLGLSYGRIQSDLNRGANTLLSQFIDAATLNNIKTHIGPDGMEFVGSPSDGPELVPGKFNRVTGVDAQYIRESIVTLEHGPANPQMMELIERIVGWAQASMQAPNVLSGEPGKSGETFRGLNARLEQASMQTSVSAGKYSDFFKQIAINNAKLNRLFMRDHEIVYMFNNETGTNEALTMGRRMYERNYSVMITADLRFTTKSQRVQEAQELVQLGSAPPLQQNMLYWWLSLKQLLEANGARELVAALGPRPPDPQTPFGVPPPPRPGMAPPGAPPGPPPGQGGPMPQPGPEGPPQPQQGSEVPPQ